MLWKRLVTTVSLLALVSPAFPQADPARLAGSVTDSSGAAIPGATINLKSRKTGMERVAKANEQGRYLLANLPAADYDVSAEFDGLGPALYSDIRLAVGQERTLHIVLQPATLTQEVNVSGGELVVIDTSSARVGVNVGEREVGAIPLNGRQLSQLYLMAPGAVTTGGGSYDNIRFNGRANQQNAIRFDGVEGTSVIDSSPGSLNGETSSSFRLQSSLENVQEFRVESSNYPAEYGTGSGAQIQVVTKSGGNQFHGGLFEYVRNDALDARNFFDRSDKAPLQLNQFGGSVGGAIVKDKAFFFASYEGLRQRSGMNILGQVPSPAARARAVPAIQPLLAAYPAGLFPTSNPDWEVAQLVGSARVNEDAGGIRLDYKLSDKYSLYGRYFRDQGESLAPFDVSGSACRASAIPQNGVLNFQQLLSPTVINETKFGYNGSKTRTSGIAPITPGVDLSAATIDITGASVLVGIGGQGANAGIAIPSGLVRANSATNGRGQPYTNYSFSFIDNLSWTKGNHFFKFGGEARLLRMYTDRLGGVTYSFNGLNDFLANRTSGARVVGDLSAPSPYNGGVTGNRLAKAEWFSGYVQDEWKLRTSLTLSYGLRYEYYTPLREDQNRNVLFNIVTGGFRPPSEPFFQSSTRNFGPRLALSWAPSKLNNRTVLRIGAGYYYGPGQVEDQIQPIESDRVDTRLPAGTPYPVDSLQVIRGYDIGAGNANIVLRAYAPGYRLPERILTYTASLQQQLPFNSILTLAYVGSQGRNLFLRSFTNHITGVATNPVNGEAILTRQFGGRFSEIDYKTSGGNDHYDSLQAMVSRRFQHGLSAGGQWTWGHSIGNTAGSNEALTAQNPFDFRAEHGNNAFDIRHSVSMNALYELPFGKGRRWMRDGVSGAVLGDWEVGGVLNARTGLPVDIRITRPDVLYRDTRNGAILARPVVLNGQPVTTAIINTPGGGSSRDVRRPDVVSGVNPFTRGGDKLQFLNPAAFTLPEPGTYGNLGRGTLHGPGIAQFDLTLHRRFHVSERIQLEFRGEIYNLFNRANFANPVARLSPSLGSGINQVQPGQPFSAASAGGAFGVINQTVDRTIGLGTSRQIQFSLRLSF